MPIKGLTDRSGFGDGLPCLGSIHKGEPKGEKRPGRDLDYFRVEFKPEYAYMAPVFQKVYGSEPTQFDGVYLAGGTPDDVFPAWREEWSSATLLKRCDGQEIVRWHDGNGYVNTPKPCVRAAGGVCHCKDTGRLRIFMPAFMQAVGEQLGADKMVFGYFSLATTSVYDIAAISSALKDLYTLFKNNLAGVKMIVGRAKRQVSTRGPDNGKPIKTTRSLIYLRVAGEETVTLIPALGRGRQAAMLEQVGEGALALPPGDNPLDAGDLQNDQPEQYEPEENAEPDWRDDIRTFCDQRVGESADSILEDVNETWESLAEGGDPYKKFVDILVEAEVPIIIKRVFIKERMAVSGQNPLYIFEKLLGHRLMESRWEVFQDCEIDTSAWKAGAAYDIPEVAVCVMRLPHEQRTEKNADVLIIAKMERYHA